MKTAVRVMLTVFAFVAGYFFIYWGLFSLIPGAKKIASVPIIGSLLCALAISVFLWKKTGTISNNLASSILVGGIIVGATGFVLGFFGPMIVYPDANLGPLIGIFYTGPIGFVLGLIGGGLYWLIKEKKRKFVPDSELRVEESQD